jgi:endonuclease I/uncharacterized protein (DUF2147 family)
MNNKTKIAIAILALTSLAACDSNDDTATISSGTTVGVVAPLPADVAVNGSFENWETDGTPTAWQSISSGITVTQNQNVDFVETGSSSSLITLTSKSNQDFRGNLDVVNGKTYSMTMSIYHTEGGMQVRAYMGGNYADYNNNRSDPSLVNQWQEYSFEYAATETKNIEIGMRFYDSSDFDLEEIVYIDNLTVMEAGVAVEPTVLTTPPAISQDPVALAAYYDGAKDKSGFELKTALYDIIKGHNTQTYGDLWTFMSTYSLDTYYENDNSILDIYTENPSASDSFNFTSTNDQCGNYSVEGDCYNREHSFPKSWFDDKYPMYTDVHHIFATDGKVNGYRSNFPYGEVETATFTSSNGSKLGSPTAELVALGFTGDTVFEPIDEFKGDLARAYFYMATRYEKTIGSWATNSANAEAVIIDGNTEVVFEPWVVAMLKRWNENDPVSPKEQYRNDAAFQYQGNRNPFVDHPEYVNEIWAD